jgi:antitoxin component YwqK of YwqJK toxin-antitoxin module
MKRLLTILCLVLLSSCSPRDGPHETFHEDDQLSERGAYKDGGFDGLFEKFYEDGLLWVRENYIDDEFDGLWENFDEDGNLTSARTFRNGEVVE